MICTMFVPIVATSAAEKVPVLVEWIAELPQTKMFPNEFLKFELWN